MMQLNMPAIGLIPIKARFLSISLRLCTYVSCCVVSALIMFTFSHISFSLGSQEGAGLAGVVPELVDGCDCLRLRDLRRLSGGGGPSNVSESESERFIT